MVSEVDDRTSEMHSEVSSFSVLDCDRISEWLLAVQHWCVCKFGFHQCYDGLFFPLSIVRQHLLEKGESQLLREVSGWF